MINPSNRRLIRLSEARRLVPGGVSTSRLEEWAHHGIGGIRLSIRMLHGRPYTTQEAIDDFLRKCPEALAKVRPRGPGHPLPRDIGDS